jgi:hypothetical protein
VVGVVTQRRRWGQAALRRRVPHGRRSVTAYADRANDEFVWAVSSPGNEAAFTTLKQE